jgi:5-methylthioadenosine/S-adenosylhomocysteine deaminase
MGLVLQHALVVTVDMQDRVLADADIRVEGTVIEAIGPGGSLKRQGDEVIDCSEALVMPGLVNVHTHAATALFRGLADDRPAAFWSRGYQVPGQERFSLDDYKLSMEAACGEYLLNGITCIADRLARMDHLATVLEASGIRAIVGDTLMDRDGPADWRTTDALLERYGVAPRSRVTAGIAPHALDTCSDQLLKACADRQQAHGAHVFIHVAQSRDEIAAIRARRHAGALACLQNAGLTGAHVVAAHCLHLSAEELAAWPVSRISIAHCPASNLKIEALTAPIHKLIGKVAIGLGTDWTVTNNSSDLFFEARLAALAGKMIAGDPTVLTARQMLRMMTIEGAAVLGLDHVTGSIETGKQADLLVLDTLALELTPMHDPVSNIVHSASSRSVRDVIVDGEILVRSGCLTRVDQRELARRHARLGAS